MYKEGVIHRGGTVGGGSSDHVRTHKPSFHRCTGGPWLAEPCPFCLSSALASLLAELAAVTTDGGKKQDLYFIVWCGECCGGGSRIISSLSTPQHLLL